MLSKKRILFLIIVGFSVILISNVLALPSLSLTPTNQIVIKNEKSKCVRIEFRGDASARRNSFERLGVSSRIV